MRIRQPDEHIRRFRHCRSRVSALSACVLSLICRAAPADLPDVPIPEENPVTEAKRVLGKMLFWDEQLSYDDTIACGTCHIPASGGADPRAGKHPGTDAGTIDDVRGSPGIASYDADGQRVPHPVFGSEAQVTPRTAPSNFTALWADSVFWDGRAGPQFTDPVTGEVVINAGGALEAQALAALSNAAEMARTAHDWNELTAKLAAVTPLALASELPPDIRAALPDAPDYPALFAQAFGDPDITPVRIAYAIASYQRTLVPDRTPWDRLQAGDVNALSASASRGWRAFRVFHCTDCHSPPLFTNNGFANIGLRLTQYDAGRMGVSGNAEDAGDMKVPSLRNVALRPRYMHTGQFTNLGAAIGFYLTGAALDDRDTLPGGGVYSFNMGTQSELDIRTFLDEALTDPRVRDELFPFDRPTLQSERARR